MTKDERFWWAVLVQSEIRMMYYVRAVELKQLDGEDVLHHHFANAEAREELVKLGVNLDNLLPYADEKVYELIEKQREKANVEKTRFDRALALIKNYKDKKHEST